MTIDHTSNNAVLYNDGRTIALNKAPGQSVQPDTSGDPSLMDTAQRLMGKQVFPVHRIDRPVSGVVLFATDKRRAAELSALFQSRSVRKIYWAVVDAEPPEPTGRLEHRIVFKAAINKSIALPEGDSPLDAAPKSDRPSGENQRKNRHRTAAGKPAGKPAGKRAWLDFELMGRSERYWFLRIEPGTGRHHQIRAQLAVIGCHIKGDVKYGAARTDPGGGIHLHARALSFTDPRTGLHIAINAAPPDDALWRLCAQADGEASGAKTP